MQVVACIFSQEHDSFKFHFEDTRPPDEPDRPQPQPALPGRTPAMMTPVIILGAIMMFVVWDTSERK
jgi:hypothetical protein